MKPFVDLDHVGIVASDLDEARSTYARLGFKLTGLSMHAGARVAGGPVEPMGSGNHCAMFERGYLEIAGIVKPDRFSNMQSMLNQYAGLHIVALGVDDADFGFNALTARGAPLSQPRVLQREVPFGPAGLETRRVAFRNLYADRQVWPEAQFLAIEHMSRETMWQPHLLEHPNGVRELHRVWMCSEDPAASARRLGSALGVAAKSDESANVAVLVLTHGELVLISEKEWRQWSASPVPALPAPVGMQFVVHSKSQTAAHLTSQGIILKEGPAGEVIVEPHHACGALVSFIEAAAPGSTKS